MDASSRTGTSDDEARLSVFAADIQHSSEAFVALVIPTESQVVADQIPIDEELDVVVVPRLSRGVVEHQFVGYVYCDVQVGSGVHSIGGEAQVVPVRRILSPHDDAGGIVRIEEVDADRHGVGVLSRRDLSIRHRCAGGRIGREGIGGIRCLNDTHLTGVVGDDYRADSAAAGDYSIGGEADGEGVAFHRIGGHRR